MHAPRLDFSLALLSAGNNNPARTAMMAMTTRSSIKVKPAFARRTKWARLTRRWWNKSLIREFFLMSTRAGERKGRQTVLRLSVGRVTHPLSHFPTDHGQWIR